MNQRIAVRAIVQQGDNILLIRRAMGRSSIMGKFELPGGRLSYGEQPEDSLRRYLHDDVGLHIETASLYDVVTYVDRDDRDIQYAVVVYAIETAQADHGMRLSDNYDKYIWQSLSDIHQDTLTDLTQLLLGIIQQRNITGVVVDKSDNNDVDTTSNKDEAVLYADGGSRGNPGPSAAGFVIMNTDQKVLAQGGEYLGITTNNQAEYHGVRLGLEKALELGLRSVDVRLDSMLVVNQMNGVYTIKNRELWPINERIRGLVSQFEKVTFQHIPRGQNQLADSEVNRTLNARTGE